MNNLVIVESPTKARTLARYLGSGYQIEASMGHVRDLPKSEFGVDIEHNFEPQYIIPRDKKKRVNELKKEAKSAKVLWLATDPDREGEAIAWHISKLFTELEDGRPKTVDIKRVVFHEITEEAIKEAFQHPRDIDLKLVDAQQARRVLDRLVGYKLSPLLWIKVKKGLSAGRVQSVALRLIVDREKEIGVFKTEEYWIIEAELASVDGYGRQSHSLARQRKRLFEPERPQSRRPAANASDTLADARLGLAAFGDSLPSPTANRFIATLIEQNGKKLAIKNKEEADGHVKNLEKAGYVVSKVSQKEVRRFPFPPFTTSTLQQVASNRLGMSAKKTMMLAQNLYEHGLITYMRTDSVNLSPLAVSAARNYIEKFLGKSYLPDTPRVYKSKSKNAQEAHEAIRPTDVRVKNEELRMKGNFNRDHIRLYDLIWKRFVACQMSEAVLDQTTVDVEATTDYPLRPPRREAGSEASRLPTTEDGSQKTVDYLLRATGSVIKFEGWLKLYGKEAEEDSPRGEAGGGEKKQALPKLSANQPLNLIQLIPGQHFTEPSPRYTEASLIKKLEELGIGRPSTYAPIISTIQDRFYVEKLERKFIPTALGITVTDFLVRYFSDIVDYSFTAQMEDELDEISRGEREWKPAIKAFYDPFEKKLEETNKEAQKVKMELQLAGKKCPQCGKELVIRIGKFGKFLACSGFPDCKHTESMEEKVNAKCPRCGGDIVVRRTRRGKTFYGCRNYPVCKFASWTKPKSSTPVIASPEEAKQSPQ